METPPKSSELSMVAFSRLLTWDIILLPTMDISSIMITFKQLSLLLNVLQTSEDKLGISPLNSVTGKANAEWSVIPRILKSALPVGAVSSTLRLRSFWKYKNEFVLLILVILVILDLYFSFHLKQNSTL